MKKIERPVVPDKPPGGLPLPPPPVPKNRLVSDRPPRARPAPSPRPLSPPPPCVGVVEWAKVNWILRQFVSSNMIGLDIGCGKMKFPGSIGIDKIKESDADHIFDASSVTSFDPMVPMWLRNLSSKCDYVFLSHFLEDFRWQDIINISNFYISCLLNDNGLFIVYVPHRGKYKGINFDHRHEFEPGDMEELFYKIKLDSILIYYEAFYKPGMYGILGIGRRRK